MEEGCLLSTKGNQRTSVGCVRLGQMLGPESWVGFGPQGSRCHLPGMHSLSLRLLYDKPGQIPACHSPHTGLCGTESQALSPPQLGVPRLVPACVSVG